MVKTTFPPVPQCETDDQSMATRAQSNKKAAFTLTDFVSVFLLFGTGVGLSFLAFCFEIAIEKWKSKTDNNNS